MRVQIEMNYDDLILVIAALQVAADGDNVEPETAARTQAIAHAIEQQLVVATATKKLIRDAMKAVTA